MRVSYQETQHINLALDSASHKVPRTQGKALHPGPLSPAWLRTLSRKPPMT